MPRTDISHQHIKRKILLPLYLVIVIFLLISLYSLDLLKSRQAKYELEQQTDGVKHLFAELLKTETTLLTAELDHYEKDQALQKFWQAKDRSALLASALPVFTDQRDKYQITHLYFNDLAGRTFLRVHNPAQYGDARINVVFKESFNKKKESAGIALGRFGTFTLRVVRPWHNEHGLTGYLEIGKEIDHITQKLKAVSGMDIFILIDKHQVTRLDWEEGRKMMEHEAGWNDFSDHLLIDQTIAQIPAAFKDLLETMHANDRIRYFNFTDADAATYETSIIPLLDAASNRVGEFVLLKNSSQREKQAADLSFNVFIFVSLAALLLSVAFYLFLDKIQGQLEQAHAFMENSHNILTAKVAARTRDLEDANRDLEDANQGLEEAIANIKSLKAFLPICSSCKKIRNDEGYWSQVEEYIHLHAGVEFSHGICPDCAEQLYPAFFNKKDHPA